MRRSFNIQRRRQGYPGQFLELDPMKATPTPRKQRAVPAVSAVAAPAPEVAAVILTLLCCPLLFPGSSLVLPWLFPCPSSALSWLFPGSLGRPWLFFGSSLAPRCSQMLQMLPDAPRCSQILPDTQESARYSQIVQNQPRYRNNFKFVRVGVKLSTKMYQHQPYLKKVRFFASAKRKRLDSL